MFGLTSNARFDPFEELEQMAGSLFGRSPKLDFELDVKDLGDSYRVEADLPGIRKENLKVDLAGDYMTISAHRATSRETQEDDKKFIRRERSYGAFSRTFDVSDVDTEQITASYADGVLTLLLPKKEAARTTVRHLEIE